MAEKVVKASKKSTLRHIMVSQVEEYDTLENREYVRIKAFT